jgi:tRNA(Met) C34 N-acetyltransferase TmcA
MDTVKQLIEKILEALKLRGSGLASRSLKTLEKTLDRLVVAEQHLSADIEREYTSIDAKRLAWAAEEQAHEEKVDQLSADAERASRVASRLADLLS